MATVTAFIPAYERPDTVRLAIERALSQTFEDLEVLVGDDSRTDSVQQVVASFKDRRVRYHRNPTPLGAMRNWVDLVHRSESEFVASLNDDDFWEPEFLEALISPMLTNTSIGISFCDVWYVNKRGYRLTSLTDHWSEVSHRDVLAEGLVGQSEDEAFRLIAVWNSPQPAFGAVMRRSFVTPVDFPVDVDPCHDLWCSYRLWTNGGSFHYTPRRLANYRLHDGNLTHAGFGSAEDFIFETILNEQEQNLAAGELKTRWARIRFSRATALSEAGEYAEAAREFGLATAGLDGWRLIVSQICTRSEGTCRVVGRAKALKGGIG